MADRESKKSNHTLRDFGGVNTRANRTVIGDNEFAWLENVMPLGYGNMLVVPGPSAALATWPTAIYQMKSLNLNGVDYEFGFGKNGACYAINLSTYAVTTVAPAGTFSGAGSAIAQWENDHAVIVDPANGYFTWDGSTLTHWNGTLQSLTVTAIGKDYVQAPTLSFSSGSAAGTVTISAGIVSLVASGSGYVAGDILTVSGGTFTAPAQIQVSAVNSSGNITGLNLYVGGDYTVAPTNPASVTGGYGSGATFNLNFGLGTATLTNIGTGYTTAPTVTVTPVGAGANGAVTAALTAVPGGGTAVATYAGRVWVATNRTLVFSAPASISDFSPAAAGGDVILVDETLHSSITGLLPANNFLYVFGSSSINVIGDVQVVSGVTSFSNTNISASIGTVQPLSLSAYYRGVWFAAPSGFHALYGTTTNKASDPLDGMFRYVSTTNPISSGQVLLNRVLSQCFLIRYNDPDQGARPLLAVFADKRWFFASQGADLIQIDTALVGGESVLYATNGTTLTRMFADESAEIAHKIVTKLWDMRDPILDKQSFKVGIETTSPYAALPITGTVDTEVAYKSFDFELPGGDLTQWVNDSNQFVQWVGFIPQWQNNFGQSIVWRNNAGASMAWNNNAGPLPGDTYGDVVQWTASGYTFGRADVGTVGKYLGLTVSSTAAQRTYSGFHLQFETRAAW